MEARDSAETFITQKQLKFTNGSIKPIKMKDIKGRGKHLWKPLAGAYMKQSTNSEKVYEILRLKRLPHQGKFHHSSIRKIGEIEYRFGYFVVGKNGNRKGKWTWGQFCPMIPREDFSKLIRKAKKEKTIY